LRPRSLKSVSSERPDVGGPGDPMSPSVTRSAEGNSECPASASRYDVVVLRRGRSAFDAVGHPSTVSLASASEVIEGAGRRRERVGARPPCLGRCRSTSPRSAALCVEANRRRCPALSRTTGVPQTTALVIRTPCTPRCRSSVHRFRRFRQRFPHSHLHLLQPRHRHLGSGFKSQRCLGGEVAHLRVPPDLHRRLRRQPK